MDTRTISVVTRFELRQLLRSPNGVLFIGTLPVGRQVIGDTRTTGDIPNDVEAVEALAGQPRALSLDGANGQTIEVVISAEWCAVTTVSVWEMPIEVVG